ncbi:MAG TPA: hypothetical protein VK507_14110 [Iamia sp.]|nr:hypothetical protein [Iamia sp.]
MGESAELRHRRVVRWADLTNKVLVTGGLASLAIVVARATGTDGLAEVWDGLPAIPIEHTWIFFVVLTIVHLFTGGFLRMYANDAARSDMTPAEKTAVYEEVAGEGGMFVAIGVQRLPAEPGGRRVPMSWRDPSTWVSYTAAFGALAALLPWSWDGGPEIASIGPVVGALLLAMGIVFANWVIGSQWAVVLSGLGAGDDPDDIYMSGCIDPALIDPLLLSPAVLLLILGALLAT